MSWARHWFAAAVVFFFELMIYVALEVIGNQPIQLFTRMCWF